MKYNEFKMKNLLEFAVYDSEFLNRKMLEKQQKNYVYFENYFINQDIETYLYQLPTTTEMLLSVSKRTMGIIIKRFDTFSDYIYDERISNNLYYNLNSIFLDVEENKIMFRFINSCRLFSAYFARKLKGCPGRYVDELFTSVFYFLVDHYKVHDSLDTVIYWKGYNYPKKKRINNDEHDDMNMDVRDWKEKNLHDADEIKMDFDFNREKEIALIKTVLTADIPAPSVSNIINILGNKYSERLNNIGNIFSVQKEGKGMIYEKLKSLLIEINLIDDTEYNNKDNIINKINNLLNDEEFNDIKEYKQLRSALDYYCGNRPIYACDELMEKYKDDKKYRFKGIVYHGYRDDNDGSINPISALSKYENGYISCSKDINVAVKFTNNFLRGGVIEIFIDDTIDAIDISKLLQDNYEKSNNTYKSLYNNFINEQEVMVKMPICKFRYLTPKQVKDISNKKDTSDHQILQTYKPSKID